MLQFIGWNSADVITSTQDKFAKYIVSSLRENKKRMYMTHFFVIFFAGAQELLGTLVQKKYKYIPVRSSMFGGLTSTMLKLWLLISKFQRFIRKSSAEINVSPSLQENKKASWSKELQFPSQYNNKIQHNWDKNLLFEMEFI